MTFTSETTRKKASKTSFWKSRRAASLWISWVLLFAFVIGISALSYRFIVPLVQDTTEDVKKVVFNTDECRQVAISLETACQDSTAQDLNMTIRNRNYIRIDKLRFQWFGTDNVPISYLVRETKLAPNRVKSYDLDSNTTSTIGFVKVTPVVEKENLEIVCSEKEASVTSIPACG